MTDPVASPRKDRARNREALLDAARELFRTGGIGVPLDTIAKRAGVGNATIYRHFPDRTQLIAEVLITNLTRSDGALQRASMNPSPWEGFIDYMRWLFAEQIDNAAYMTALRAVPTGIDVRVDHLRNKTLAELEELIARAKGEGRFRPDRWIEDVFLVLALNEQLPHGDHADPQSASQRFLELFIDTVAVHARGSASSAEPATVLALRRTLGSELTGLPPNP